MAKRGGSGRAYAAVAGPLGLHVVEYVQDRRGLEIVAAIRRNASGEDPGELAVALAEAVSALGGRGGTLVLALSGFGAAHHILTLPDAASEVLEPVVRRELLRYTPELGDVAIGFTAGPEVDGSGGPKRELLVGAVPRRVAERLHAALASRGLRLTHLTVFPRALQGVYDAFDGGRGPAVAVLLLESGPLIGCFHEGALRLFIEPPLDIHGRPLRAADAVAEQVARATLFLRQQFPGSGTARVLVATPTPDLESALRGGADGHVQRLAEAPAGSLAALGAALDAASDAPLQLLPRRLRPPRPAEVWTRRIAATAAMLLVGAAVWWSGSALVMARTAAATGRAAEARLADRAPWLASTGETLVARRAHADRRAFLERTAGSREDVGRILAAVAAAAPPAVQLEAAHVRREEDGAWSLLLAGTARGPTGSAAVRAVDALYRGVPSRLPAREVELGRLEAIGEGDGPVALAFDMSFIVRWERDLRR